MRFIVALLAVLGLVAGSTAVSSAATAPATHGYVLVAQQQGGGGAAAPSGKLDVNIDVNRGHGGAWWTNPVWIAIGVIALILLIVLLALAFRGGGTTVIRE